MQGLLQNEGSDLMAYIRIHFVVDPIFISGVGAKENNEVRICLGTL